MQKMKAVFAVLLLTAAAAPALAQQSSTSTPGIDKRQANQERRIQQGVDLHRRLGV